MQLLNYVFTAGQIREFVMDILIVSMEKMNNRVFAPI